MAKRKQNPSSVIKEILYQSSGNCVEYFSLTKDGVSEYYIRRGNNIELVTEKPNFKWKPKESTNQIDLKHLPRDNWRKSGGLDEIQPPKHR